MASPQDRLQVEDAEEVLTGDIVTSPTGIKVASMRGSRSPNTRNPFTVASGQPDPIQLSLGSSRPSISSVHSGGGLAASGAPTTLQGIRRGQLIATGGFGSVYMGLEEGSGKVVAVKEIKVSAKRPLPDPSPSAHGQVNPSRSQSIHHQVDQLRNELAVLKRIKHRNVVSYIGSEKRDNKVWIVMEYVPGGSLKRLLEQFGPLPNKAARRFVHDVVEGLQFIHAHDIVHCDVKAANILVDVEGVAKIADFGAAHRVDSSSSAAGGSRSGLTQRGTLYWMPPEAAAGRIDFATDVWSLGCMMMELFTGKHPWAHLGFSSADDLKTFIKSEDVESEMQLEHVQCGEEALAFMRRCLRKNPEERPTAEELLEDPFLAGLRALARQASSSTVSSMNSLATADFQDSHSVGTTARVSRSASGVSISFERLDSLATARSQSVGAPSISLPAGGTSSVGVGGVGDGSLNFGQAQDDEDTAMKQYRSALAAEALQMYGNVKLEGGAASIPPVTVHDANQILSYAMQLNSGDMLQEGWSPGERHSIFSAHAASARNSTMIDPSTVEVASLNSALIDISAPYGELIREGEAAPDASGATTADKPKRRDNYGASVVAASDAKWAKIKILLAVLFVLLGVVVTLILLFAL